MDSDLQSHQLWTTSHLLKEAEKMLQLEVGKRTAAERENQLLKSMFTSAQFRVDFDAVAKLACAQIQIENFKKMAVHDPTVSNCTNCEKNTRIAMLLRESTTKENYSACAELAEIKINHRREMERCEEWKQTAMHAVEHKLEKLSLLSTSNSRQKSTVSMILDGYNVCISSLDENIVTKPAELEPSSNINSGQLSISPQAHLTFESSVPNLPDEFSNTLLPSKVTKNCPLLDNGLVDMVPEKDLIAIETYISTNLKNQPRSKTCPLPPIPDSSSSTSMLVLMQKLRVLKTENTEYCQQIDALNQQLDDKEILIVRKENDLLKLMAEKTSLMNAGDDFELLRTELCQSQADVRSKSEELNEAKQKLLVVNSELDLQLNKLMGSILEIGNYKTICLDKDEKMQKCNITIQANIEAHSSEIEMITQGFQNCTRELEDEIVECRKELGSKTIDIERMKTFVNNYEEIRVELGICNVDFIKCQEHLIMKGVDLTKCREQLTQSQNELSKDKVVNEKLENEMIRNVETLESTLENFERVFEVLKNEISELNKRHESDLQEIQKNVDQIKNLTFELNRSIYKVRELDALKTDILDLKNLHEIDLQKIQNSADSLKSLTEKFDLSASSIRELESNISKLNKRHEIDLQEIQKNVEHFNNLNSKLDKSTANLREFDVLKTDILALNKRHETDLQQIESNAEHLQVLTAELDQAAQKFLDLETAHSLKTENYDSQVLRLQSLVSVYQYGDEGMSTYSSSLAGITSKFTTEDFIENCDTGTQMTLEKIVNMETQTGVSMRSASSQIEPNVIEVSTPETPIEYREFGTEMACKVCLNNETQTSGATMIEDSHKFGQVDLEMLNGRMRYKQPKSFVEMSDFYAEGHENTIKAEPFSLNSSISSLTTLTESVDSAHSHAMSRVALLDKLLGFKSKD